MNDPRPNLGYRSLFEYIHKSTYSSKLVELFAQQRGPCPGCGGTGRVVAPYERPDPVEGYKIFRARLTAWKQRQLRRKQIEADIGSDLVKEILELWK